MDARVLPDLPCSHKSAPKVIHAELRGSDCASASWITVRSGNPVLKLCRELIEAGHDPRTPLEAWRCDVLCLRVRSIGEAANLEINGHGTGFKPRHKGERAPPVSPRQRRARGQGGMTP
jgi:hypothetical protein